MTDDPPSPATIPPDLSRPLTVARPDSDQSRPPAVGLSDSPRRQPVTGTAEAALDLAAVL